MCWHASEKLDIDGEFRNAEAMGIPYDEVSVAIGKTLIDDPDLSHLKSARNTFM